MSMRIAASDMNGGVVVIGNAPTALLEVIKMIQEKVTKTCINYRNSRGIRVCGRIKRRITKD